MAITYDGLEEVKDVALFRFSADAEGAAERMVEEWFTRNQYKLEKGTAQDGVFGIGNPVLRIFLGGLVKRFTFRVVVDRTDDQAKVIVRKGGSGLMGGIMGMSAMKGEYRRVVHGLQAEAMRIAEPPAKPPAKPPAD